MSNLYDGRKKTGYSSEEAYFHAENKKLIQEMRKKNGKKTDESEGANVIDAQDRFAERRASAGKSGTEKQGSKKAA